MNHLDLADGLRLFAAAKVGDRFGHTEHLRFAWSVLDEAETTEEAERVVCHTIRHVSQAIGDPGKFNHTLTTFWMRVLELHAAESPGASLDDLIELHPELLDIGLPHRHWSDINRVEAKRGWVEPDVAPIS
ncbi:MAG TPA: hypothetical protein VGB33_08955 [Acidimicrobiia bacterium]|jgi:hypothetical protein